MQDGQTILIRGGRVIDPATGFDQTADVIVSEGVVQEINPNAGGFQSAERSPDVRVIDADGCIVAPGLVDIHVHFREPHPMHRETIASGAASAINGGFTTVCCMPNTNPPLDNAALIEFIHRKSELA